MSCLPTVLHNQDFYEVPQTHDCTVYIPDYSCFRAEYLVIFQTQTKLVAIYTGWGVNWLHFDIKCITVSLI